VPPRATAQHAMASLRLSPSTVERAVRG
jgi:hypothetical protein